MYKTAIEEKWRVISTMPPDRDLSQLKIELITLMFKDGKYRRSFWSICKSYLDHPEDIEDAIQSAYLTLLEPGALDKVADPRPYTMQVIRSKAIELGKTLKKRRQFDGMTFKQDELSEWSRKKYLEVIRIMRDKLNDNQYDALMAFIHGSYKEAAEDLFGVEFDKLQNHEQKYYYNQIRGRIDRAKTRVRKLYSAR